MLKSTHKLNMLAFPFLASGIQQSVMKDGQIQGIEAGENDEAGGRRRRRESTTMNIDFGGRTSRVDGQGEMVRPALVKSSACTDTACQDCGKLADCWHGVSQMFGIHNPLIISVPANSAFTRYVAEVWAKCPSTGGKWAFTIRRITNGKVTIFHDSTLLGEVSAGAFLWQPKTIDVPIASNTKSRMRAAFSPIVATQESFAEVRLDADGVDKSVDDCMTVKDCVSILVDGGDAGFELRNVNVMQLHCLTGNTGAFSSALKDKCIAWMACMDATKKTFLTALLKAAVGSTSLISDVAMANHTQKVDPITCVNPESDDPESWECACLDEMTKACGGEADEECFLGLLCSRTTICATWKDAHCPAKMLQAETGRMAPAFVAAAAKRSTKASSNTALGNSLDGSFQGKCAEQ